MLFNLTNPEIAILMMGIFLFTVLLGFPIAFTLILTSPLPGDFKGSSFIERTSGPPNFANLTILLVTKLICYF